MDDAYFDLLMECLPFLGYENFEAFIEDAVVLRYGVLLPLLAP